MARGSPGLAHDFVLILFGCVFFETIRAVDRSGRYEDETPCQSLTKKLASTPGLP
jgi:hypothetical protein